MPQSGTEKRGDFRQLAREFLWARRGRIALALFCMIGFTAMELLAPWPLKIIIDQILLGKPLPTALAGYENLLLGNKTQGVLLVSLGILFIAVLEGLFSYLQQTLTAALGHQMVYALRCELVAHLQQLSLSFHNRTRTGELLSKVTGETEALKDVFVESILLSISHVLTVLGMFAVMFLLNWRLSLVVLATFPLLFFALSRIYRRIKLTTRRQREREGKIAARLSEVLSSVRLVKAYGREAYEQERFQSESRLTLAESVKMEQMSAAASETVGLIKAAGLWATVLYGALLAIEGSITPGAMLVFIAYLNDMFKPLRNLAKVSTRFSRAAVSMQRINELLAIEPERWNRDSAIVARQLKCEIVFDHVSFDYGDGKEVLHDVSFRIAPGQHVALVGSSGSGKSTIVSLILRFYHASSGVVRLDGMNIEEYERESLRGEIGVALQDALIFGASIRENIAYGKPDATAEEIETAARQAYAHDFIQALPEGYDTVLGERGSTLSGGQRQRICLARALIKTPSVLILDEPTSSVDAESAALIHEAIDRIREDKTTLVIAHQFSNMEAFDQILVLRQGRLVEHGTHQELLDRRGDYSRMYQRRGQAQTALIP